MTQSIGGGGGGGPTLVESGETTVAAGGNTTVVLDLEDAGHYLFTAHPQADYSFPFGTLRHAVSTGESFARLWRQDADGDGSPEWVVNVSELNGSSNGEELTVTWRVWKP